MRALRRQTVAHAPRSQLIQVEQVSAPSAAERLIGSKLRAAAAVLALGVVLTFSLAFLTEGSQLFDDYVEAMHFAQDYAMTNRELMMVRVLDALRKHLPVFKTDKTAINCHHNYATREQHFGERLWVTRKGAVRAGIGELGIIPGSMGTGSFIVEGLGNAESFCSCSHGAGRVMSRTQAAGKRRKGKVIKPGLIDFSAVKRELTAKGI